MNISRLDAWRRPGCTSLCWRRSHDPEGHERYGYAQGEAARQPSLIRSGPLVVDIARMVVTVDGAEVRLTWREWGVLAYLAEHAGAWCPNADIVRAAWGPEWVGSSVDLLCTNLDRLRRRLGSARSLIETARGGGRRRMRIEEPAP